MRVFWSSCLHHAIVVLALSIHTSSSLDSASITTSSGHKTDDKLALLAFKNLITKDPFRALDSWNDSNHFCDWSGVTCSRHHRDRVTVLELDSQELEGKLSPEIGNLSFLRKIDLDFNKFSGAIPASLSNASRLEIIYLSRNQFTGSVPRDLGRLQHLRTIKLYSNLLGTSLGDDLSFINSLTNCTKLHYLDIGINNLYGSIPTSIGTLKSLTIFFMDQNRISGAIPTSLSHLTQLSLLYLSANKLHGSIPTGIGRLKSLIILDASQNRISGAIPTSIGNLTQLKELYLSGNELHGSIPPSLMHLPLLFNLNLSHNDLNGSMPSELHLRSLNTLDFSYNSLSGAIPYVLGNCSTLEHLYMQGNLFDGSIPPSLMHLPLLLNLNLSHNDLNGSMPSELHLRSLNTLDFSYNSLSGAIPYVLGNCSTLEHLYMQGNLFDGKIPQSLGLLRRIYHLDLSSNKFSGQIPNDIGNSVFLTFLNLSYNDLDGPVPMEGVFADNRSISVEGNNRLCGGVMELKLNPCRKRKPLVLKVFILVVVVSLFFVALICFLRKLYQRRMQQQKQPSIPSLAGHQFPRISYVELRDGTNCFSADTLIGVGRYGTVYKGFLEQFESIVAVKVLNLQEQGASKSFSAECNALRNLRHRNLVKIITCCSSVDFQGNDFKALVYEFIPNGSLEEWLHQKRPQWRELTIFGFLQRLNIAIDVASGLDYLHHHCKPAVVHCDLKPSNILLDDEMTAHVSDFGLAKVFSVTSSHGHASTTGIKGSIGFIAPEYGMGGLVSIKGDVYSFGILLLEMFIGKRPTDDMFQDGRNLHNFAAMALPEQVMNIMDPTMLPEDTDRSVSIIYQSDKQAIAQDCLVSIITLGVKCSAESPMNRLNMAQVVTKLHHIKEYHQGTRIHLD